MFQQELAIGIINIRHLLVIIDVYIPYEVLARTSNEIINKVKGVNRVCYDISSKPPATIEWE